MKRKQQMLCIGLAPLDGCGVSVTIARFRQSGAICEYCQLDWEYRVRSWNFGNADSELDELYGPVEPKSTTLVRQPHLTQRKQVTAKAA